MVNYSLKELQEMSKEKLIDVVGKLQDKIEDLEEKVDDYELNEFLEEDCPCDEDEFRDLENKARDLESIMTEIGLEPRKYSVGELYELKCLFDGWKSGVIRP